MSTWSGVAAVAIALAIAVVAVGQPVWQWNRSEGADYETWSYYVFNARHTVHNSTTATTTVETFAYPDLSTQPHLAALFLSMEYLFLACLGAAVAAGALSVATVRRKLRGIYAGIALLGGSLLAVAIPVFLALDLTAAAAADLPRLNGTPIPGFQGQMTLPQSGAASIVIVWGPALAWYVFLALTLVLAFGATEVWSLKPARRIARTTTAAAVRRLPPLPEPPAPVREEPILEEVFVIGSNGLLIKHMSRTLMSEKDRDIVGGMISVLSNFVRETFTERDGGGVQEITLGHHRFILCNESGIVVAVLVTRGATEDIEPRLRHLIALLVDRYGEKLEEWHGEPLEGIEDEIAVLWQPFFLPPPPAE